VHYALETLQFKMHARAESKGNSEHLCFREKFSICVQL
jgi:hypothetical protein